MSTAGSTISENGSSSGCCPRTASALEVVLSRTVPVMIVMGLTVGVSVYLYIKIPKGFFPQQDTGRLQGNVQGQQHISYQSLVEKVKWFEEQVRNDPAVEVVNVTAGSNAGGRGGGNNANMNIQLKTYQGAGRTHIRSSDRTHSSEDRRACRAPFFICKTTRTFASAAGRAMPNTSTRSRRRTWICSRNGDRECWRVFRCFRSWWTSVQISRIRGFRRK